MKDNSFSFPPPIKDVLPVPEEALLEIGERTLIREWVKDYLRYLHWYWTVGQDPWASIEDLLEAPVYHRRWFVSQK